jgi:hypothetical protein
MRRFLLPALLMVLCVHSQAQLQLGVFGGIANYQGDLLDKPYKSSRPVFGLSLAYPLTPRVSVRAGLSFARVAGADSLNKSDLQFRNLSFQSPITELSLVGEFNTFDLDIKRWSPYVFAGVAVYHFNPYTFDRQGNKVYLQPLSTEGQGLPGYSESKKYSLNQLAIPFGGGIKYVINDHLRLAVEVGLRKLFTDHLDDVSGNYADPADLLATKGQIAVDLSYRGDEIQGGNGAYPPKGAQRGSPKYKDYYYFTGLHLVFNLPEGKGYTRSFSVRPARKSSYGCPSVF